MKMSKQAKSTSTQHANATTTPEMRAFIHESDLPTAVLSRLLKVSESTIRKWRKRASHSDASHVPKQLNTTLSEAQEYVVVELRTRLLLSLDELLAVCKQFINVNVYRAGLQRCLKRHGVSQLGDIDPSEKRAISITSDFDQLTVEAADEKHVSRHDITQQALAKVLRLKGDTKEPVVRVVSKIIPQQENGDESEPSFVFVASDPDTRWVYVDIYQDGADAAAARYMSYVLRKAPFHIRRILANNYAVFKQNFRVVNDRTVRKPLNKMKNVVDHNSE